MEPHVRIFDTTLRDGEQAPGCTMTLDEKLEVARQLARMQVDIIEAGFPAASPGDWAAVHEIARQIGTPDGPVIAGLARANKDDIDKAATAVAPAANKRIHVFISSSDIHIEHQLRSDRASVLAKAREMVAYARQHCADIEFSPMDATRSEPQYVYEMLAAVIEAGATTLNIPDTVGYATPEEYAALIAGIRAHVCGAQNVIISTHCHDDLGMAVANSLAGVRAGARQIECTINGIGERAGNASLEEVVMALHTRQQLFGVGSQINTRELSRASKLLATIIGMPVPPNKAIVGANAFAHESGIHQDGILKNRMTYEIMDATTIGLDGNELVLGKHSGRNAFRTKLAAMGYEFDSEEEFQQLFGRFKELCDKKKVVDDRDIQVLVTGGSLHTPEIYKLEHVQVTCGTGVTPVATVRLAGPDGDVTTTAAHGTGPVDAIYKAIDKVVGRPTELIEFSIKAVTEGIDAQAEVSVRIREPGTPEETEREYLVGRHRGPTIYSGYSANTDTLVAAAESYLAAVNKLLAARQERLSAENAAYAAGYDRNRPTYAVDLFGQNAV
jgi:2-isopropylmalate synthase